MLRHKVFLGAAALVFAAAVAAALVLQPRAPGPKDSPPGRAKEESASEGESAPTGGQVAYSSDSGVSFTYPATWSLTDNSTLRFIESADKNPSAPALVFDLGAMTDLGDDCEGLGSCQEEERALCDSIEQGTAPGFLAFTGGRGSLIVTCSGNEGYDNPIPTPLYEFRFCKDDQWISLWLNDLGTKLNEEVLCEDNPYLNELVPPNKAAVPGYDAYNAFVDMIQQSLVLR